MHEFLAELLFGLLKALFERLLVYCAEGWVDLIGRVFRRTPAPLDFTP